MQGRDGKEYWVWHGLEVAQESVQGAAEEGTETDKATGSTEGVKQEAKSTTKGGKVTGSNYETPEERAIRREFERTKHRQIGRQGCINSAINLLVHNAGKSSISASVVISTAKELEDFVFNTPLEEDALPL
jgi:hypothetical protein